MAAIRLLGVPGGPAVVALLLLAVVPGAWAAFPGENGKIAFVRSSETGPVLWTINPDGSGETSIGPGRLPRWSPDGKRLLAMGPLRTMDPDGGNSTSVLICQTTQPCVDGTPSWSPDGLKLTWGGDDHCLGGGVWKQSLNGSDAQLVSCAGDRAYNNAVWSPDGKWIAYNADIGFPSIYVVRADGSGGSRIIGGDSLSYFGPEWHPSNSKLLITRYNEEEFRGDVYTIDPDGTDAQLVVPDAGGARWSPDGNQILVVRGGNPDTIWLMDADGTDARFLTTGSQADWQPIPINSYPRPKGATPLRISLAIAYDKCVDPNRTHAPPLAFASCSPPTKTSQHLTVGTGDSNGLPARNDGYVRLRAVNGDPATPADEADVAVEVFSDDVFTNDLTDYTGELRAELPLRITDKDSTPHPGGPGAATTVDLTLHVDAPCAAVADPKEGSTCEVTTTVDALIPGAIKEGRRSIWAVGQVIVWDGGPDGDVDTADNTVFARQGVFIP